jgi:hypothetical protein
MKPATLANPASFPDVGTVLATSTPFGPGVITSRPATMVKLMIVVASIRPSAPSDLDLTAFDAVIPAQAGTQ